MSEKGKRQTRDGEPKLWVNPKEYLFPDQIQVFGDGWPACPVAFYLGDERRLRPARILVGTAHRDAVKPELGRFVVLLSIPGLKAGEHVLTAVLERRGRRVEAKAVFVLEDVPETEEDGRPTHRWYRRRKHFMERRFPEDFSPLPGSRLRALRHRNEMRKGDPDQPGPPVDPGCNWYCIGPSVVRRGQVFSTSPSSYTTAPISGRITSLAFDPNATDVLYAATAQGGVWKSTDGGLSWRAKSDFAVSLAIGSVTVDPSVTDMAGRSTRILAGTGEPNTSDSYYGAGMLFSSDGGETWAVRGTATFLRAAFSTIAVDPTNNQHLYAATDIGVYESIDEGVNWNQIEPGICHDLVVDWDHPGGPELYVGRFGVGVRRSQDGGASWTTLGGGLPASAGRIALAMAPSDQEVLYAAFSNGSGGLTGIYRTSNGGNNWSATAATPPGVGQSGYNLVLGVHPTAPNTVLFGEVHLWRSTTGGGAWTRVSTGSPGIHADQHAIAFHPTDGSRVYVGNDGGVFYSSDGGATYVHRNKDLATLQYWGIGNHPLWDAVMIGGTQDNGAQRYLGHPAWEHSALGDGAFAAINATTDNRRWFETRWWGFPCFRSDSAGAPGSWVQKAVGIATNSNWFYPPFEMDPNDSRVLYVGYDELWRSGDSGDSWTAITGSLVGSTVNITAIAIAPSDSNTLYVGMQNGRVYKVTFSGTWTATNVTGAPLPAGQISDIAIHPTDPNTVYVTTSNLIFSEGAGEFTNDHVFKTINGGTSWTNASAGLAQTNPVNTVAIDPTSPNTVFIGADVGIFRSNNGGTNWAPWDDGLPNCSVQDLKVFAPGRLLRAATHGRSVWERPIDAALCPLVDVYLRDDFVDTGLTQPTPSNVDHPFIAGQKVHWWQSVDIKVDSPDPVTDQYQTPTTDIDYVQFEELTHDNPRRSTFVRLYVQVHNRGNLAATNVQVRPFWANAGGGLPDLPSDFWTAFPTTDPSDTTVWHPVGPARTVASLLPGQPQICSWVWLVPSDAPSHSCMLAAVTSDQDAVTTTSLSIGTAVRNDNNVTLKNLHVDDFIPGAPGAGGMVGPFFIDFAVFRERQPIDLRIDPGQLPRGARIFLYLTELEEHGSLEGLEVEEVDPIRLPRRPEEACVKPTRYELKRRFGLEVGRQKGKKAGIFGLVPEGEKLSAAFFVELPEGLKAGQSFTFDLEHWVGNAQVGGSTYELRVRKPEAQRRRNDTAD